MVKIEITLLDDGRLTVTAPFGNKALCYGLLESAKDVVRVQAEQQSAIQVVGAGALPSLPSPTRGNGS